jgi:hypothetical protein
MTPVTAETRANAIKIIEVALARPDELVTYENAADAAGIDDEEALALAHEAYLLVEDGDNTVEADDKAAIAILQTGWTPRKVPA